MPQLTKGAATITHTGMDHTNRLPDGQSVPSEQRYHDEIAPPSYQTTVRAKSTLDLTSRIERKFAQYNASQNVFKRWLFEILSVATSAICMGKEKFHLDPQHKVDAI
jgi:hypothetical protein